MHVPFYLLGRELLDPAALTWLVVAADVLALASIPSVLRNRRGHPLRALSWVLALLAVPFLGALAWWMWGREGRARLIERRSQSRRELYAGEPPRDDLAPPCESRLDEIMPFRGGASRWRDGVFEPTRGNKLELLVDGDAFFPLFEAALADAEHEIVILFYIWEDDETAWRITRLLASRARAGCRVRLLVDGVGGRPLRGRQQRCLEAAGVEVAFFMPAKGRPWRPHIHFRNHRKIVIIDRAFGFMGGMNVGDEYTDGWHDLMVRVEGPIVGQLHEVFREDWFFATGERVTPLITDRAAGSDAQCGLIASGPDTDHARLPDALYLAFYEARERLWLITPYFVPPPALLQALRTAALRGVDVRLVLPTRACNDLPLVALAARSFYLDLLDEGVRIFEYNRSIMHAKLGVIDDDICIIGSANLDRRSMHFNYEVNAFIQDADFNARAAQVFRHDCALSAEIEVEDLEARGSLKALVESFAHLISPLL